MRFRLPAAGGSGLATNGVNECPLTHPEEISRREKGMTDPSQLFVCFAMIFHPTEFAPRKVIGGKAFPHELQLQSRVEWTVRRFDASDNVRLRYAEDEPPLKIKDSRMQLSPSLTQTLTNLNLPPYPTVTGLPQPITARSLASVCGRPGLGLASAGELYRLGKSDRETVSRSAPAGVRGLLAGNRVRRFSRRLAESCSRDLPQCFIRHHRGWDCCSISFAQPTARRVWLAALLANRIARHRRF